eukprot:352712-Chlamydomonas_euryale.AAC.14
MAAWTDVQADPHGESGNALRAPHGSCKSASLAALPCKRILWPLMRYSSCRIQVCVWLDTARAIARSRVIGGRV